VVVLAAMALAAYQPASRATRIDPAQTLRADEPNAEPRAPNAEPRQASHHVVSS
jgi:hypothetical protein